MKILWYFLTLIFGAIGVLALLRSIEIILIGAGISPGRFGVALIFLFLAWLSLIRARSKASA